MVTRAEYEADLQKGAAILEEMLETPLHVDDGMILKKGLYAKGKIDKNTEIYHPFEFFKPINIYVEQDVSPDNIMLAKESLDQVLRHTKQDFLPVRLTTLSAKDSAEFQSAFSKERQQYEVNKLNSQMRNHESIKQHIILVLNKKDLFGKHYNYNFLLGEGGEASVISLARLQHEPDYSIKTLFMHEYGHYFGNFKHCNDTPGCNGCVMEFPNSVRDLNKIAQRHIRTGEIYSSSHRVSIKEDIENCAKYFPKMPEFVKKSREKDPVIMDLIEKGVLERLYLVTNSQS